jgi:hypothetical protein
MNQSQLADKDFIIFMKGGEALTGKRAKKGPSFDSMLPASFSLPSTSFQEKK